MKSFVFLFLIVLFRAGGLAQPTTQSKATEKTAETEATPADSAGKASDINLLSKADTTSGESRRNENVQFNLIDNYSLKEANLRLGTTATIIREFAVDRAYFGAEFGTAPKVDLTIPTGLKSGQHGQLRYPHLNSIFSARSFFQVSNVKPARTWSFKKDLRMTFRAESVNFFNTPQFAEPGFELSNPNFGLITNTLNDRRPFRCGLQIGW